MYSECEGQWLNSHSTSSLQEVKIVAQELASGGDFILDNCFCSGFELYFAHFPFKQLLNSV